MTGQTVVPMRRISSLCLPVAYPADLIIVFEAVYEAGSIARAADRLALSQSGQFKNARHLIGPDSRQAINPGAGAPNARRQRQTPFEKRQSGVRATFLKGSEQDVEEEQRRDNRRRKPLAQDEWADPAVYFLKIGIGVRPGLGQSR